MTILTANSDIKTLRGTNVTPVNYLTTFMIRITYELQERSVLQMQMDPVLLLLMWHKVG